MKYYIAMRVFDKRNSGGTNYLHKTIGSMMRSGLFDSSDFELHLFDGGSKSMDYLNPYFGLRNTHVHKVDGKITNNENWLRSVDYAERLDCDHILCVEDDILVCDRWIESIKKFVMNNNHLIDTNPMVSFYAPYSEIKQRTENRDKHWKYPYRKFYGTQCVMFRKLVGLECSRHIRNAIENMDQYNFNFRERCAANGMKSRSIDLWLQEWGINEFPKQTFVASCPSYVQHIGRKGENHLHQSHFLGEDWSYN